MLFQKAFESGIGIKLHGQCAYIEEQKDNAHGSEAHEREARREFQEKHHQSSCDGGEDWAVACHLDD